MKCFLAIDFDGTIAKLDVNDVVLEQFATPEWLEIDRLWQTGKIGSEECLRKEMALIDTPLSEIIKFVEAIEIDSTFICFIHWMQQQQVSFAIISDGFRNFIDAILVKNGLTELSVFANELSEIDGKIVTSSPYSSEYCSSGTCKCMISQQEAQGLPIYLIGDGRSDFCLAGKADFVYAKAELLDYCMHKEIPHCAYNDFSDILEDLRKKRLGKSVIA